MAELKPGKYLGKVIDYTIGKTNAGLPQAIVMFDFKDADGNSFQQMWFGSLKEKARRFTIDALLACGFRGEDLAALAEGVGNGALDTEKDVQLTVTTEPDQNGNPQTRIRWVNEPGMGGGLRDKLNKGEAAELLGGLNLTAEILERREKKTKRTPVATAPTGPIPSEEVPF